MHRRQPIAILPYLRIRKPFDIERGSNRHLAFAAGIHTCAGMSLARIEGRIALGAFFEAFDAPEIRVEPEYHPRLRFRGLKALEMRV